MRLNWLGALALAGACLTPLAAEAQAPAAAAPVGAIPQNPVDYLAANAKQPGVQTLPSGLQYKVIQSGPPGPSPKAGDVIKVHYEGALTTGQVFDSSIARGKPLIMPLANLVPAWMEALPRMHVGDEWMLYVPPALGYGPDGSGPIPPNAVLVFRVKLLGMLSAD
ncbi:FKBP-type peptidyl-prolyl cis-trans isomerase [Phenylobacterium sp.]|uniref:FKBP-type peptidyl-prolyl cis-trans isomerase n=1 Tax=Phenylobacterium sp. TaxID=1871053 RepID=UPI00122216FE|nr:FKBP-type peptidyl-prolyl cis-trans isomerase [Phenylobacterium sp.]THD64633.1 MAG: FKBP-type peptidyl-prolyl cis-trans isomerase [Phenylobacterium sp.]